MTRYEREALAVIRNEHRQTRRPVTEQIVRIGCNATSQAAARAVNRALERLRDKGLVGAASGAWLPTVHGMTVDLEAVEQTPEPEPAPDIVGVDLAKGPDTTAIATIVRQESAAISAELVNRCAAMHQALWKQATAAYERGEAGAAGDLLWLAETGKQLLAAGGVEP
ncbi:hypothetical protein [Ectothiorhodospira mobilis]|uniref:hypothetical protein n=1 Tax=Ectothiorhodospira mobilis TaxID=195064 RepID=UPI001907AE01|nr:hypothetical protein [Ectothiorhodospira mobilis]MBK1691100.1 hypothetical protein [Ectothiorhodospira mobilis]